VAEQWTYWVTFIIEHDGRLAISGQMMSIEHALNDQDAVGSLIYTLNHMFFSEEELQEMIEQQEEGDPPVMPVVPITWQLIRAQRGPGVKSPSQRH